VSADLVDPFATPPRQPLLTPEEWRDIRDEIRERNYEDRALHPELVAEALRVLGEIATGNTTDPARIATQALRGMVYRAHVGAWRHEVEAEPAWSLDSYREPPLIRHVETIVEDL
jgi:hypothetical protein